MMSETCFGTGCSLLRVVGLSMPLSCILSSFLGVLLVEGGYVLISESFFESKLSGISRFCGDSSSND